jgi:hypothetical protein
VSDIIAQALQRTIEERNQWRAECQRVTVERDDLKARLAEATAHNNDIIRMSAETIRGLEARLAAAERLLRWAEAMVREFPETYLISVDSFLKDAARADGAGEGGK